jgi:hypothetical protein
VHHALGRAGRARGVDDHRQIVGRARPAARERLGPRDDLVPLLVARRRREREGDARHALGHARLLLPPGIELADEQQLGVAVLEHVADGVRALGREDRDRGAARHPYRELGDEEVRAVLGQDRDVRPVADAARAQMRSHPPGLIDHLGPGVVDGLAAAVGLRQEHPVGVGLFVVVDVVKDGLGFGHGISSARGVVRQA